MHDPKWLASHIGTLEDGIRIIDQYCWCLTVSGSGDNWQVWGGDQAILTADSREVVDAFLYGMALAYSVLPEKYAAQLREELDLD
ncbi:MAG: hypothetical protein IT326_09460 [Anaerolineae bacterium]|nr:hypothetical protein [Anaerolineae bacterium]